jgi:hypothetical protein
MIDDPSWAFSGIAIHKALQLGMYRPVGVLLKHAHGDEEAARAIHMSWITCVIVNQMYAL